MVLYNTGKDNVPYSSLALEFLKKIESGKKNTVFQNIIKKLSDPSFDIRKKNFLSEFAKEDFKLMKSIIIAPPDELEDFIDVINSLSAKQLLCGLSKKEAIIWRDELQEIVGYSHFKEIIGNKWFVDVMHIPICPYCNLHELTPINNKNGTETIFLKERDHFMEQSKYPLFSMSFFNLIPSCKNCNQVLKKPHPTKPSTHMHPYLDSFHSESVFRFQPPLKMFPSSLKIKLEVKPKAKKTIKTQKTIDDYRLNDIYSSYKNDVDTMLRVYKRYNQPTKNYSSAMLSQKHNIQLFKSEDNIENFKKDFKIPNNENDIRSKKTGKLWFDFMNAIK